MDENVMENFLSDITASKFEQFLTVPLISLNFLINLCFAVAFIIEFTPWKNQFIISTEFLDLFFSRSSPKYYCNL